MIGSEKRKFQLIGGSDNDTGIIIINGGNIIAYAGGQAAGIGSCYGYIAKLIVIRGGTITAIAGSAKAECIGSGENYKYNPHVSSDVKLVGGTINDITYTPADETYTVTIPADVKLGETADINVSDVTGIEENYDKLCVKLSSDSTAGDTFQLASGDDKLDYNIKIGDIFVSTESNIIEVCENTDTTVSLKFTNPLSKPTYAGEYSGTLTFTISVEWQ